MKRVLVTGATGFIGTYCIPLLLKEGYEVHALSRLRVESREKNLIFHQIDLLEADSYDLLQSIKASHFLHLAWETEHGKFWNSPQNENWLRVSLELMNNFWVAGGDRFVTAGTCAEYDWADGVCEEGVTPEHPQSLYGEAKLKFSRQLFEFSNRVKMSSANGRIFFLYGPGEKKTRLVPSVALSLLKGEAAACTDGEQIRDFLYVGDVARAFVNLLSSPVIGIVNIASGEAIRIKDLLLRLQSEIHPQTQIIFGAIPKSAQDPAKVVAKTKRLREELQFKPQTSLEQGLKRTIEWLKQ